MTDETEFDPTRPGLPREVHEDTAARERSMTAEEWARELAWTISGTTFHGHDDFVHKVRAIATKTIAKAEAEAHAAGKAEGAAEERAACAQVCSDFARDATYSNQADPCEDWATSAKVASILANAIRQRSEEG